MMQDCPAGPVRVCILGAGVVGLSTAVQVVECCSSWRQHLGTDVQVTLIADRFSPDTTSDVSGGFWEPYSLGDTPVSQIRKWSIATWEHMLQLACSPDLAGEVGAQFVSGYNLSDALAPQEVFYKDVVFGFRHLTSKELQLFPFARSGHFYTSLQLSVKQYLPWLMHRFLKAGGIALNGTVEHLLQVSTKYDVIVNCCGAGAGKLMADWKTVPIRGQVRRVRAPWIKHFYLYESSSGNSSYLLPVGDDVVVGGVAQRGRWSEEVDAADSMDIWNRATSSFPQLQKGALVSELAGLRPGRDTVRLEEDEYTCQTGRTIPVIHNYGHGGAGVTLHWGCATEATALVRKVISKLMDTRSKL